MASSLGHHHGPAAHPHKQTPHRPHVVSAPASTSRKLGAQSVSRLNQPASVSGSQTRLLQSAFLPASQSSEAKYAQWAQSVATVEAPSAISQAGSLVHSRVVKTPGGAVTIRHLQEKDLLAVAQLQAASFHEPLAAPLKALDPMAFTMFKAEVLDAVQKKTKVLAEDGFTILVVEGCSSPASSPADSSSRLKSRSSSLSTRDWDAAAAWNGSGQHASTGRSSSSADSALTSSSGEILGVIEVGVQDENDVLQHLPRGMETYAYISSMAVASHMRRSGLGAALLQAAEQQALLWGQQLLALHVYETNNAAIRLYQSHGLTNHAADPAWRRFVGGKVRQLMVKWL